MSAELIGVGRSVRLDGDVWLIERIVAGVVHLLCDGQYRALPLADLIARREPFEARENNVDADELWLASQPPEVIRAALEKLAHLNEAATGYRSGYAVQAAPGEPREAYDPDRYGTDVRMRHKATELGCAVSTLYRRQKSFTELGLRGLVDARQRAPRKTIADGLDDRLLSAIRQEMDESLERSNIAKATFRSAVSWRLRREFGDDIFARPGGVKEPSRSTYDRALSQIAPHAGFFKGTAENRRSIASRPNRAYRGRTVDRPGQVVLIDSTPLDLLFFDPATQQWTKGELHGAMDAFDYQIIARRIVPVAGVTAVDAALLLRDMMVPKVADPSWPEEARWRYHGLPETLVLHPATGEVLNEPLSSIAPRVPNAVLVDRAGAYRSASFEDACASFGIDIDFARPRRGSDKPHIERLWNTIGTSFCQHLAGYTGGRPHRRGRNIESDAVLLKSEVEAMFDHWNAVIWQNTPRDGLRLEEDPKRALTPAEMFDEALTRGGYVRVPSRPDAFHRLLPGKWRRIHDDGVRMAGLRYDGDDRLDLFRDQVSPYGGIANGRWFVRFDPRDLNQVWFHDPDRGVWLELPWKGRRNRLRALDASTVDYAKRTTLRTGDPDRDAEALQHNLQALQDNMRDLSASARERRLAGRAADRAETAASERHGPSADPRVRATERAVTTAPAHAVDLSMLVDDDEENDGLEADEEFAGVSDIDERMADVLGDGEQDPSAEESPLAAFPSLGDLL